MNLIDIDFILTDDKMFSFKNIKFFSHKNMTTIKFWFWKNMTIIC